MKKFAQRSPLLFAVAVTAAAMMCLIWPLWVKSWSLTVQALVGRSTICIFAIVMLISLGWWREAGFQKLKKFGLLLPYLPLLVLFFLLRAVEVVQKGIHVTNLNVILIGLAVYLLGGFFEEAVWRGLVLHALRPGGLIRATLISSVIFGLAHLANLLGGANLNDTLFQVVYSTLAGFCFVAPLAITRNIWPLIVIHGSFNFVGYLTAGGFMNTGETTQSPNLITVLIVIVPFLVVVLISMLMLIKAQKTERLTYATA